MRKAFLFLVFLTAYPLSGWALRPPFDPDNTISTDFGPRIHPTDGTRNFHDGIDYNPGVGNSDQGRPIPAVQSGKISLITKLGRFGWVVTVKGKNGSWDYAHLFDDSDPAPGSNVISPNGKFELGITTSGIFFRERAALKYLIVGETEMKISVSQQTDLGELFHEIGETRA